MRLLSNPIFCFAVCCVLLNPMESNSNAVFGWQAGDDNATSVVVKVYPFTYTDVFHAEEIVGTMIAGKSQARISYDPRTNSMIVSGTEADHQFISQLIQQIDVQKREPVNAEAPGKLFTIPLEGLSPDVVRDVLESTLQNRDNVRLQVIDELGVVILSGDEGAFETAKDVIQTIRNSTNRSKKASSVYVSMTFVVDGRQIGEKLTHYEPPSSKIGAVLKQAMDAELISMTTPLVVSKTVNRVRVESDLLVQQQKQVGFEPAFVNRSESGDQAFSMSNTGYIAQVGDDAFQISASIGLEVMTSSSEQIQGSAELNADLEVPLNHPVLLSFSTILGVDSAVIIEVHEAK